MSNYDDDDLGLNLSVPWFETSEPKTFVPPSKEQRTQIVAAAASTTDAAEPNRGIVSFKEKKLARQQKLDLKRSDKQQKREQKLQDRKQQHLKGGKNNNKNEDEAVASDDDGEDDENNQDDDDVPAADKLASLAERFAVPNQGTSGLSLTRQEKKVKPTAEEIKATAEANKNAIENDKKAKNSNNGNQQQQQKPAVKQYQTFVRDPVATTTATNSAAAVPVHARTPFDDKKNQPASTTVQTLPPIVTILQATDQQQATASTKNETTSAENNNAAENRKQRRQRERDERDNEKEETETELKKVQQQQQQQEQEKVPTTEEVINTMLHPRVKSAVQEKLGFTSLTYVQRASFPHISNPHGGDVVIRSETGSGKTLAYALPLVNQIVKDADTEKIDRTFGTLMIVMAPTRELAEQCADVITKLVARAAFVVVGCVHGGDDRHHEKNRLRKGIHILVCTPGRLLDHLKLTNSFTRDRLRYVVLDEADRLLDMGFERSISEIMYLIPKPQKRILVSATVTAAVERLSHFVLEPPLITVGKTEDVFEVPDTLTQKFVNVPPKHRLVSLAALLWSRLLTSTVAPPAAQQQNKDSATPAIYSTYIPPNKLVKAAHQRIVCFVSTSDAVEFLYLMFSRLASPFYPSTNSNQANQSNPGGFGHHNNKFSVKKMTEEANQHLNNGGRTGVVNFDNDDDDEDGYAQDPRVARAQYGYKQQQEQEANATNKEFNHLSDEDAFLRGADVFKLHGNMSQVDRQAVYDNFKKSSCAVLFCTDVAARGLDIPNVDLIIHYDPPIDSRSYVHRVGRTARIGTSGESILFLMPHEVGYVNYISRATKKSSDSAVRTVNPEDVEEELVQVETTGEDGEKQIIKRPKTLLMPEVNLDVILFQLSKMDRKAGPGRHWVHSAAFLQKSMCDLTRYDQLLRQVSLFAYQSSIRAYAGMPREVKRYFDQRQLHLGHIASSFANSSTPAQLQRDLRAAEMARRERTDARDAMKIKHQGVSKVWDEKAKDGETYHSTLMKKALFETKNRVDDGTAGGLKTSATASKIMTEFEA